MTVIANCCLRRLLSALCCLLLVAGGAGCWPMPKSTATIAAPHGTPATRSGTVAGTAEPTGRPRVCTPVPDQEAQLAAVSREWLTITWLPDRLKLCGVVRRQGERGEMLELAFEGEGRYYNQVWLRARPDGLPPSPKAADYEIDGTTVRLREGVYARETYIRYGLTRLAWPVDGLWVELDCLGDALDRPEAIRMAAGIAGPSASGNAD